MRIVGQAYKGLLMQARLSSSDNETALGVWSDVPLRMQLKSCDDTNDSVTHSSADDKSDNLTYTWTPPQGLTDPVQFL